ncbi:hypothetical protein KAFR_0H02400 [Kazachstania africana CBS 2517]|uniref:Trimethylguanosine synthase n=1 Tax=Kazachstania africana (strain ATCC 22294 / BCRC 22015 / CBS 2517 / CECT 1963 / NBRC 1671 / NRRL Y-8276) TaxID=1071382 RepID=H2AZ93_KAZAF|nr:hypothetical protein KAFR_0H02400 [Kazachstania africana CBS 2517]CCF59649.1 hypothetical protein KAFR_0H02400 [Kazachstania africana CBS 2517]
MGKKVYHASHFLHTLKKRSNKRYRKLVPRIADDNYRIKSHERLHGKLFKYWKSRHSLFSKIDSNQIYMTEELWYSVTPEVLAKFLAKFIKACLPEANSILDVFCGGGGNTIQFAMEFPRAYGVDSRMDHLYCTAQNAKVYGVDDRIWLKYGTWDKISKSGLFEKMKVDCVFASPPWGGPEYSKQNVYDLESSLQPVGVTELLKSFFKISSNVLLFLPRNSDLHQIARTTRKLLGPTAKCRVLYVKDNGYLKGIVCMWGVAFTNYQEDTTLVELNEVGNHTDNESSEQEEDKEVSSSEKQYFSYDIDG